MQMDAGLDTGDVGRTSRDADSLRQSARAALGAGDGGCAEASGHRRAVGRCGSPRSGGDLRQERAFAWSQR
jgi:hypothetical protein